MSLYINANDHIQGSETAPVEVVEYADFQCPYCKEAYYIIKEIQKKFGDSLRFVFRNFPISEIHQFAIHAAMAAETAALQNKFWEMHDTLFENQNHLTDSDLRRYAEKLGLDMNKFEKDFEKEQIYQKIKNDYNSGISNGVQGTPTFFINGNIFSGNWLSPQFAEYLETFVKEKHSANNI